MPHAPDPISNTPPPDNSAEPNSPTGQPFSAHRLFVGREGLRAGWSLLLFFTMLAALLAFAGLVTRMIHRHADAGAHPGAVTQTKPPAAHPNSSTPATATLIAPREALVGDGVPFLCVVLATWVMAKLERRPNSIFGFARPRRLPNFLTGLCWGLAMLTLLVFSLRATGLLVFDDRLLFGRSALGYAALWLAGFLIVALFEEYLTRGYLQFTLTRGLSSIYRRFRAPHAAALGFWTAALILSCAFGLVHTSNEGESPIGLLSAGLIGMVFCLSLWRTGSLWWAIGFHAAWDWAESFLYGVADSGAMVQHHLFGTHPVGRPILSGGATGPEGSILILPIVALTTAVILLTLRTTPSSYSSPGTNPDTPQATRAPQLHLDLP